MEVTKKTLPKSQIELTVKVTKEEMLGYMNTTAKKVSQHITVPGFRKGEAPKELVEKHVGSATLFAEAVETAVNESYKKAIEQENITPLAQAQVALGEKQDETGVEFTATVSVMPEVTLPDYKKIAKGITKEEVIVEDKDIEEAKQYLLKSRGEMTEVDRKAKKGDTLTIGYTLTLGDKELDTSDEMPVEIGGGKFIPGFEDEVKGLSKGDTKKFDIDFPKEYHNEDLSGKTGTFDIEVKKVEESKLPEWNDDFAKEMSNGSTETVAELEKNIREGLEGEKSQQSDSEHSQKIMDAIMDKSKAEIPEVLIDSEKQRIIQEMEQRAMYSGETLDVALERTGKTRESLLEEATPQAESRVLLMLILRKIAELEKLTANEDEVVTQMATIMTQYPKDQADQIDTDRLRMMVEGEQIDKMTLQYLSELSKPKKK